MTVAAMTVAVMAVSAAPTFAVPEDFLSNAEGPLPEALNGLPTAESKTKSKPGTGDIVVVKVKDKATPIILE